MSAKPSLVNAHEVLQAVIDGDIPKQIARFAKELHKTFKLKGKILACGNGGSHCDALHLCEELTGRYHNTRIPLGAVALGEATHLTCVSNDFGFKHVFSRQVEALGKKDDLLVCISTSGNSQNVNEAARAGIEEGMYVVGLIGNGGGSLKHLCHLPIIVPSKITARIQEIHTLIIHTAIEEMEKQLFPELTNE